VRNIKFLVIHHTDSNQMTTRPEHVDGWHKDRGWARNVTEDDYGDDLVPTWLKFNGRGAVIHFGYHGLIDGHGIFHPGRPFDVVGAQAKGVNDESIGLCLAGDFQKPVAEGGDVAPTKAQLATLVDWLALLCVRYRLDPAKSIYGHRDVPGGTTETACPGTRCYILLDVIRRRVADAMPSPAPAPGA
jgi:hypothetical protein